MSEERTDEQPDAFRDPVGRTGGRLRNHAASYPQETEHARADSHGVQRADVVAGTYWFRPDHLIVKANEPVLLTIKKQTTIIPHSFVIHAPEAGIDVDVPLRTEPTNVEFTPTRPGTYVFYCDEHGLFGAHRAKGMTGVLEVVR